MSISGYRIVSWTQHWSIIDGCIYRDAIAVRLSDNSPRLIAVKEES